MFAAAASVALCALALRAPRPAFGVLAIAASGACLAVVVLSWAVVALAVFGFWSATWVTPAPGIRRARIVAAALTALVVGGGVLLVSQHLLDADLLRGMRAASVALTQAGMWGEQVRRTVFAFGPLLLLVPAALATPRRDLLV